MLSIYICAIFLIFFFLQLDLDLLKIQSILIFTGMDVLGILLVGDCVRRGMNIEIQ